MDEQKELHSNRNNNNNDSLIGKVLFEKYLLVKKLGEGSFGCIYSAKENNNWYAIKFENKNKGQNLLENEAYIMSYLNGPRIPAVKSFGYSGDYNVLIMELMGKSLEDLFENLPNKKMTVRCVCNLGYQMIEIMEYIHNKHIIHRDIKPDNFVMGKGDKKKYLFLLDFGLSKKYRSSTSLKHYPLIKRKKLTGTARYASINALNGVTQSRRDDLEAIGYVLMYFLKGRLPWQGLINKNKDERYLRIMEVKRDTTPEELCKGFPIEFERYISYTRNLDYEEEPDYELLKNLFLTVLKDEGYNLDYYYDWDNDVITMTTADTNINFGRNELNNFQLNQKNMENENEEKNKIIYEEKEAIFEEKENNEKNEENDNIKESNNNNENKGKEDAVINGDTIKDNNHPKENDENNGGEKNDRNNGVEGDGDGDGKKNEDIKLDAGIDDAPEKNHQRQRRHEKYAICGHRNNEDNKCCILF